MGGTITEDQKVAKILNTLPSSMRYFVAAWESLDPKAQTLNNLTARLLIEETRNQQSGSSKQDEALLHRQARTKPKDTQRSFQDAKKNTKCHYCHKIGHWSRECRKRLANEKNKSKNLHDSKGSSSDYGLILCDNQVEPNDIWYADSGASCSMTFRREWFKTYTPFTSDHPIYLGDNSTLLAEGMGDIEIQAYVDGGWYNTYIRNVLYSPQLKKNLYSLSTSTRRGFNVIIKHDKLQIFMDNDLKAVGVRHDGLYRMLFKVTSSSQGYITSENKLQLWHERLAHLPVATLREMATKGLVDGLQPQDLEGDFFFCEGCQLGKAHRKSCYPSDGKNYQLGYENTSKNFRLWDWKTRKIRISKDVTFDEKATPHSDRESTKPKEIIFQINSAPDESPVATTNIPVQEMLPVSDISSHPMITRSKVSNSQSNFALADEPSNYIDAITSSDSERWKLAMDEEIDALNKNKTWTLERLADGHKPIGCKWVYKIKTESDGTIQRFKARLVAKGYSQIKNVDYFDTFSPVVRYDSLRILLSHAASERMFLKQFDVKTAFLNGELEELVYLEQPEGYKRDDNSCYRLHKSLYGLRQSSRNRNKKFTNFLYSHNFKTSDADPCIFIGTHNDSNVILALYVDDGIILSKDKEAIAIIMDELEHAFDITSGSVNFFVGLQIEQSEDRASIFIHQSSYIDKILSKFNMADCIPASVPMDPSVILTKQDCPTPEQKEKMPKFPFREAVGSLMFASCVSRPDITYAVSQVSKFLEYPGPAHCTTVKNIFRYLKGTPHMGILFTGQDQLVGYSDSDFARDVDSRKKDSRSIGTSVVCSMPARAKRERAKIVSFERKHPPYLRNRVTNRHNEEKTPFELWFGKRPALQHLRAISCETLVHVPKQRRNSKLQPRATKGILPKRERDTLPSVHFSSKEASFQEESNADQPVDRETEELIGTTGGIDQLSEILPENLRSHPMTLRSHGKTAESPEEDNSGGQINATSAEDNNPTYEEAMNSPEVANWIEAIEEERESLERHDVWQLQELPKGIKPLKCRWVLNKKINAVDGTTRYKVRLVAKGFTQRRGIDYNEVYTPVSSFETIRLLTAIATEKNWFIDQFDVKSAYLHGTLNETIYMEQPECFKKPGEENLFCKLKKSIYGLKQSGRCWNKFLNKQLHKIGFQQNQAARNKCRELLNSSFEVKYLGPISHMLGVSFKKSEDGSMTLSQSNYIEELLQRFRLQDAKGVSTPMETNLDLSVRKNGNSNERFPYRELIGGLSYLSQRTRPDIAYAVGTLSRYCDNYTRKHWEAGKRVLRYLKSTKGFGITYRSTGKPLIAFSDASWASDIVDRKGVSGHLIILAGAPIIWRSTKQTVTALSTMESEYIALSSAVKDITWVRNLMEQLKMSSLICGETKVFCDNRAAISHAENYIDKSKTRHFAVKYHFVREKISEEAIKLFYTPSAENPADFLTKPLARSQHEKYCRALMDYRNKRPAEVIPGGDMLDTSAAPPLKYN
ncbi:hypothetical protein LAZ67_17000381, partial [Cordylochernes scorpioides]